MVVYDSDYAEKILKCPASMEKDITYDDFKIVTEGISITDLKKWKLLRKPLNKLFNNAQLQSSKEVFNSCGETLCELLKEKAASHEVFNIKHFTDLYSQDTLSNTHFLHDLNELRNNKYNFAEKIERFIDHYIATTIRPTRWIKVIYNRTAEGIERRKIAYSIREMLRDIISSYAESGKLSPDEEEVTSYCDILLNVGKKLNLDLDGISHLGTDFIVAGFETTSVGISSCLLALAMFPDVQKQVYQEQLDVMGTSLDSPTKDQLSKMNYLDRVVYETFRLWCPIGIQRNAAEDIKLDDDFTIPKGTSILLSLYMLHRNSKYYEKPFDFYPDHFLPEKVSSRPKSAYAAFSFGQRGCPGKQYGLLSTKLTVSRVVRRFDLKTKMVYNKIKYVYRIMPEPDEGYMIEVKERKL